jgi:hypothetical protein
MHHSCNKKNSSRAKLFVRCPRVAVNFPPHFMATLKPFAALRPKPELASQICELPYDVMSSDEAREIARGNPLSFLHVSKPEIDLPAGTDIYAPEVYTKGGNNFQKLISGARSNRTHSRTFICIGKSWANIRRSVWLPPQVVKNISKALSRNTS